MNEDNHVWYWMQDGKVWHAVFKASSVAVYNEEGRLVMRRTNINRTLLKQIELNIVKYGAKCFYQKNSELFKFF